MGWYSRQRLGTQREYAVRDTSTCAIRPVVLLWRDDGSRHSFDYHPDILSGDHGATDIYERLLNWKGF